MAEIWRKILSDPQAKKFIEEHPEFGVNTYKTGGVAFDLRYVEGTPLFAEVIAQEGPYRKELQLIADNLGKKTLAEIADGNGIPRRHIYSRIRQLKALALSRWKRRREALLNARSQDLQLDTDPALVAVAVRELTRHGKTVPVYCISRDGCLYWVDANGQAFTKEIQDILCDLDTAAAEFEELDVT